MRKLYNAMCCSICRSCLLLILLCATLAGCAASGSATPTATPKPPVVASPTAREALIARIEAQAQRDFAIEGAPQTDRAYDLFKDDPPGLSRIEITQIYQDAYARLQAERDAQWWRTVLPSTSLLIIIRVYA